MRIKNLKNYRDKETKERCIAGQEREVSAKRGAAIIKAGYAIEVKTSDGGGGDVGAAPKASKGSKAPKNS